MTAVKLSLTGAPPTSTTTWETINWEQVTKDVHRLQMRIAKAFREGKHGRMKALQWVLTHSFSAKLLAVKRVVSNRGKKTPGVDNVIWVTPAQKLEAANALKRRGYKTLPLRRIYIPKKQKGEFRPLSIPAMHCRAQQALHLLALEPIAEETADKNSYGFRPLRSAADAIEQCHTLLAQKASSKYVLEGDIKACFDNISHQWMMRNIPMDKEILRKWLDAGYIEQGKLYPTKSGAPQGGVCSPTILNIVLSGLETAVKKAAPCKKDKVHICVYADDFIATGATSEILENKVKPAIETFLEERGLVLSKDKTKITHIDDGFDFLSVNIRKYNNKLIMKPAKSSVKRMLASVRKIIKANATAKTEILIEKLNQQIRGWTNYFRHICSKSTFQYVDHQVFSALWCWAKKRHPKKGKRWIGRKYFRSENMRNWIFSAEVKDKQGTKKSIDLIEAGRVTIKRHIKIRGDATPYNPIHQKYLHERLKKRRGNQDKLKPVKGVEWWNMLVPEPENEKDRVTTVAL